MQNKVIQVKMSDVLGENEVEDILDKLAGRGVEVSCNCVVREGVM